MLSKSSLISGGPCISRSASVFSSSDAESPSVFFGVTAWGWIQCGLIYSFAEIQFGGLGYYILLSGWAKEFIIFRWDIFFT